MPPTSYPIAVLSFNRPLYLRQVLQSLRAQTSPLGDSEIFLFQDGYRSKRGKDLTDPKLIAECVACFESEFPGNRVFYSGDNLGVALNFDRAERFFFEELKAPAAFFFEDDLVLSPHYMTALYALTNVALQTPKIAYVAAYGDHRATLEEQRSAPSKVVPMHHKWGFSLTRRQWYAQRDILGPYLDIVSQADYRDRDQKAIYDYFRRLGYGSTGTSQDGMKDIASCVLGTTKIMSFPCFGRYIGEIGLHSRKLDYDREEYSKTTLYPDPPVLFQAPSDDQLDAWISESRATARSALKKSSESAGRLARAKVTSSVPNENQTAVATTLAESSDGVAMTQDAAALLDTAPDVPPLAKSSSAAMTAADIAGLLFGSNPTVSYKAEFTEDLQGWNSNHPVFRELIAGGQIKNIFDVGVWKGASTIGFAKLLREYNAGGTVVAIDTFLGSAEHWDRARQQAFESLRLHNGYPRLFWQFMSNVKLSGVEDYIVPLPQTSENAALILAAHNIKADLIHIDAAHEYEPVLHDALSYWPLLNPGGYLIGDDYHASWPGVIAAAAEFCRRIGVELEVREPKWIVRKPLVSNSTKSTERLDSITRVSAEAFARALYRVFLFREPDPVGFSSAVRQLCNGGSFEEVLEWCLRSPEFGAGCERFIKTYVGARAAPAPGKHPVPLRYVPLDAPALEIESQVGAAELTQLIERTGEIWAEMGATRPHHSVLSSSRFLPENIDKDALEAFWASGKAEARRVESMLKKHGWSETQSKACVEYGCGIGRLSYPLAEMFGQVYAYDISPSHLEIAREVEESKNLSFILCTEDIFRSGLQRCDFFYSSIVFQHNPPPVIRKLISMALASLNPGGLAIFQVPTYAAGYSFNISEYLKRPKRIDMEMHVIPQAEVFTLISEAGCELREVREDGAVGRVGQWISNTLVVTRPGLNSVRVSREVEQPQRPHRGGLFRRRLEN